MQINELLHRADAQIATCEESRQRANSSKAILAKQDEEVDELHSLNNEQENLLGEIFENITDCKDVILNRLSDSISNLTENIDTASQRIDDIRQFVDSRHCKCVR